LESGLGGIKKSINVILLRCPSKHINIDVGQIDWYKSKYYAKSLIWYHSLAAHHFIWLAAMA
jgi:hypothetical protein